MQGWWVGVSVGGMVTGMFSNLKLAICRYSVNVLPVSMTARQTTILVLVYAFKNRGLLDAAVFVFHDLSFLLVCCSLHIRCVAFSFACLSRSAGVMLKGPIVRKQTLRNLA